MRYRRSDPEQSFEEYLKKPCISDRGFLFEQRLKECLSDPKLSLNAVADLLGVGASTIGQYAKKSGIDVKKRRKASYYSRDAIIMRTKLLTIVGVSRKSCKRCL